MSTEPVPLLVARPDLAEFWHPTRNAGLDLTAVLTSTMDRADWACPAGHEWRAPVERMVRRKFVCFSCERSLAALRPDLAALWHPSRNGRVVPDDVFPGSNRRFWWRCPAGHEWIATVGHQPVAACPGHDRTCRAA